MQAVEPEIERLSRLIHMAAHIVYDHASPLESGIPLADLMWGSLLLSFLRREESGLYGPVRIVKEPVPPEAIQDVNQSD